MMKACIVPGCKGSTGPRSHLVEHGRFCSAHWFSLPIEVRRKWWDETEYGEKPPNEDLRALILETLLEKADADGHQPG